MHIRESERMPSNVAVRFPYRNAFYAGTVKNLSDTGMYIDTEVCFPIDLKIEVFFRMNGHILKVPVEIVRIVKSGNTYESMGVKLLKLPEKYLEFIIRHSIF